jgi:hypothetical protein
MRINRLLAAAALSLVIAGFAIPAWAVPADKGAAASKDCRGADVRAVRVDDALCSQRATIARFDSVPSAHLESAAGPGFNMQWLVFAALAGVVIAGVVIVIGGRRRPSARCGDPSGARVPGSFAH